ncbi:MAG: tetratricopeptide repeat protein [Lachnospiraceae bacterium]|nr:tetratricopeptide repeat protein [Lachnospiraceae bacterium]
MGYRIVELKCPGCDAALTTESKSCPYCGRPIVISAMSGIASLAPAELNKHVAVYKKALGEEPGNGELLRSAAFCCLKLGMRDKALSYFEKAIEEEPDDPELLFYASVALLGGKKAFLAKHDVIDRIDTYMNAALMLEERGIWCYFWAYVKYDFYERKFLRSEPDHRELLRRAAEAGCSEYDIRGLFELLGVDRPAGF